MSYNRFQYWVRGPRHKKLGIKFSIQRQIDNGDFEYPNDVKNDLMKQKKSLEKRIKEYQAVSRNKGLRDESIRENIDQIYKKARVSIMKVEEELVKEELKRLDEFKQACFRSNYPFLELDVKQMIWDNLIEICLREKRSDDEINNTSAFYIEYNNRIERYMRERLLKDSLVD